MVHEQKPEQQTVAKETKAEAFKRLAGYRVSAVLDRIEMLDSLANRNTYEFTDEQVQKMRDAINARLDFTFNKFKATQKASKGQSFEL